MASGKTSFKKYRGWEDDVVKLIPHQTYVKLSHLKGVEFYGTPFFMSYFIPPQEVGCLVPRNVWEVHWEGVASGLDCFRTAKKILAEFFKSHYNIKLLGITPIENKKACKMARLLGFLPTGQFLLIEGIPHILSIKEGE